MQLPHFLSSGDCLRDVESMLSNLKEVLGKDRHLRSMNTMASSRDRMPHSFQVLREWRSKRVCVVHVTKYFACPTDYRKALLH